MWSHKQLLKIVSHTPVEVELFGKMMAAMDWIDVPRRFVPEGEKLYSWWSYRNNDWRESNRGRRLDHILASPALAGRSAAITSTSTCATGSSRPTTCRCWRRSTSKGEPPL